MLRIVLAAWIALFALSPTLAQDATVPADTKAEAIDRLIVVLEDPALRDALLAKLKETTVSPAAPATADGATDPQTATDTGEQTTEPGLIDAVSKWSTELIAELPTSTFGVPFDQKAGQAWAQVASRVQEGVASGQLIAFASWALPSLVAIIVAAWALRRLGRPMTAPSVPVRKRRLIVGMLLRAAGHVALFLIAAIAVPLLVGSGTGPRVFLTLCAVILLMMMVVDLTITALSALAPARGVRFIRYCQTRFYPWWLTISFAATFAGLALDPELRRVVGWSAIDVLSFAVNLIAAIVTLAFIVQHRRAIGKLIFGSVNAAPPTHNPFRNALGQLAERWHLFAYAFLALSVISLVAGQRENDVFGQVLWSFGTVLLALAAVFVVRRLLTPPAVQPHRTRGAVSQALFASLFRVLRLAGEVAVAIATLLAISRIWGFDLWSWLMADGQALAQPLFAVAVVALIAWLIWVALDAWIASALTLTDAFGRPRHRSNRAQTLLPLVRNGAMILLVVLTAIAVLANIGVDVTPLIAGAGVFGLALSFGSQQLVQDVITGIFILAEDTIAIGDTVNTGDRSGVVESISLRTVRLRDADGALHSIPFSTIKALKNSSRNYGVFRPRYAVPSAVDPEEVLDAMREATGALRANPRFSGAIIGDLQDLGIDEINAGSITVSGSLRTQPIRQAELARAFNGKLREGLAARGIAL